MHGIINATKVHRTWLLLKITYTLVPIIIGLDKCLLGWKLVNWAQYVSPVILNLIPFTTVGNVVLGSGIIEIVAGLIVWFYPRFGGYLVAAWLLLIVINLVSMSMFYDIAARDVTIAIGSLALAWLTEAYE
jgi:hypothetical protein